MHNKTVPPEKGESYISKYVGDLLQVAQCVAAVESSEVEDLCQVVLHHPPATADELEGESGLNWNGSPLQLLISTRNSGSVFRFIGDPAFFCPDPIRRFTESKMALKQALAAGKAKALEDVCWRSLESAIPCDDAALQEFSHGMIWLALTLNRPGIAAYFLAVLDKQAAWHMAHHWADTLLPHPGEAQKAIAALEPDCRLLSVGIEGQTPHSGRAKLYWRLSQPMAFSQFGISMFNDPAIAQFLAALMREHPFSLYALTFSAGFSLETGLLTDIKVDLSNRSADLSVADAVRFAEGQAETLGLDLPPTRQGLSVLPRNSVSIGFLGLGLTHTGEHRLNTYLFQNEAFTL
ncbi:MAG: hypothetical protein HXS40_07410 [Theionarchaea archaeon]|nr:hypothetical protein [Theionarchaea archaeon]